MEEEDNVSNPTYTSKWEEAWKEFGELEDVDIYDPEESDDLDDLEEEKDLEWQDELEKEDEYEHSPSSPKSLPSPSLTIYTISSLFLVEGDDYGNECPGEETGEEEEGGEDEMDDSGTSPLSLFIPSHLTSNSSLFSSDIPETENQ